MCFNINDATKVTLYCSNPLEEFVLKFDSFEEAKRDIEERTRWGELLWVSYTKPDGSEHYL